MIPTKFWFIWSSGFSGEEFLKSANQKQESPVERKDKSCLNIDVCIQNAVISIQILLIFKNLLL
jgi:hypothetical protein